MVDLTSAPYRLSPRKVLTVLVTVSLLLAAASLFGQYLRFFHGRGSAFGFIDNFDIEEEANFPTYYSTMILLAAAILLAVIARLQRLAGDPMAKRWLLLSAIFVFMSLDESIGFHELVGERMPKIDGAAGIFLFAWVIPAGIAVLIVGLYFIPFLWKLAAAHRRRFIAAGLVYVGGALGVELVESAVATHVGNDETWTYQLVATAQESMEMLGISIFIWALLKFIESQDPMVRLTVDLSDSPRT